VINGRYGYRAIAAILRAQITSGELRPGDRIPTERDLQAEYGVGRETARRAHQVLADEGLVDIRHGYASRVRAEPLKTEIVVPHGAVLTARMPTPEERADLSIAEGVPVVEVTSRRAAPLIYPADRHVFRNA
jgi:GntR family transcriptional regulator